jgi:RimJ/RimL family protein N-acetyltransferase
MASIQQTKHILRDETPVLVRAAQPEDAANVLALTKSIVKEGGLTLAQPAEFTRSVEEQQQILTARLANPNELCVAVESGGKIIGSVSCENDGLKSTAHWVSLFDMWVHADRRRNGVGKLALTTLINWAEQHPVIEKIGLFVFSTSTPAVRFYENLGFVHEGLGVGDMKLDNLGYVDTVFMAKWVSRNSRS